MYWKPGSGRLRFAVSLLLTAMILVAFPAVAHYYGHRDPSITANLILVMGLMLSLAIGLMDSRRNFLEREIKRKSEEVLQKNSETKMAEIASAAIYQSSRILFSHTDFHTLLEKVMDLISKVIYADEGSVMLLDSNRELYIAASRGIPEMIARNVHLKIGEKVAGIAARECRDFLIVDGLDRYPEFEGIEPNLRIRSSIVCPLVCQNELLGVLNLNRTVTHENFTVADMINVSIFASQVALALRNAYLYQALENKVAELEKANARLKQLQNQLQMGGLDSRKAA